VPPAQNLTSCQVIVTLSQSDPRRVVAPRRAFLGCASCERVVLSRTLGRPPAGTSPSAWELLLSYPWPGNVRERRNILERAAILCDGALITPDHIALSALVVRPAAVR
jgi:hypothetical protein